MNLKNIFSTIFLFVFLSSFSQSKNKETSEPVYIYGENGIEIDRLRQEVRAFKNAYVRRGSSTLYGDVIYGYYKEEIKGKHTLTKVDAVGNVKITMPDKTLKAREGTYNVASDVILFRGDVRVTEKTNHLKGAYATMDRKTGKTIVLNHDPLDTRNKTMPQTQNQVQVLLGGKVPEK